MPVYFTAPKAMLTVLLMKMREHDFSTLFKTAHMLKEGLKKQLDIVDAAGLSPKVMQFLHTVPIVASEMGCTEMGPPIACYTSVSRESSARNRDLIYTPPQALHFAGIAQSLKRAITAHAQGLDQHCICLCAVLICTDIVHIEDIDPRQAQALKAVLERAHDAVIGIVVDCVERQGMAPAVGEDAGRVSAQ